MLGYCESPVAIITEFAEGGSLKDSLDKSLSPEITLKIIKGIVAGSSNVRFHF
jgi:hypothetical protein